MLGLICCAWADLLICLPPPSPHSLHPSLLRLCSTAPPATQPHTHLDAPRLPRAAAARGERGGNVHEPGRVERGAAAWPAAAQRACSSSHPSTPRPPSPLPPSACRRRDQHRAGPGPAAPDREGAGGGRVPVSALPAGSRRRQAAGCLAMVGAMVCACVQGGDGRSGGRKRQIAGREPHHGLPGRPTGALIPWTTGPYTASLLGRMELAEGVDDGGSSSRSSVVEWRAGPPPRRRPSPPTEGGRDAWPRAAAPGPLANRAPAPPAGRAKHQRQGYRGGAIASGKGGPRERRAGSRRAAAS